MEELNDTRVKWYDIGLQLRMSVGILDAIKEQYDDPSHCLRETLKTWLKTCPSPPTWKNIVDTLRRSTVGEVRLAADLEQKYCSTQYTYTYPANTSTHPLVLPAPPAPSSKAHTQMTLPPQYTISPTQPPVLAYSVTPPSQPPHWSAPYYYSQHTSYPLPLTPPTSEVYSYYLYCSSIILTNLSSQPNFETFPAISSCTADYPPDSNRILLLSICPLSHWHPSRHISHPTICCCDHTPSPRPTSSNTHFGYASIITVEISRFCIMFHSNSYCMGSYIGACSTVIALILCILKIWPYANLDSA